MTIEFEIVRTGLADTGGYRARVRYGRVVGIDKVVDEIVRQGSTITRADILGVLEGFQSAIERLLLEGYMISTPFARFGVTIKGVFEEGDASFDPALHRVEGTIRPGKRLQAVIGQQSRVVRKRPPMGAPRLLRYVDAGSGERNGRLTPGGMGELVGHWLKVNRDDPAQGVFFIAADGSETRVEMLGHNRPTLLVFIVPAGLAPGEYRLQVRVAEENGARYSSTLDAVLTV